MYYTVIPRAGLATSGTQTYDSSQSKLSFLTQCDRRQCMLALKWSQIVATYVAGAQLWSFPPFSLASSRRHLFFLYYKGREGCRFRFGFPNFFRAGLLLASPVFLPVCDWRRRYVYISRHRCVAKWGGGGSYSISCCHGY